MAQTKIAFTKLTGAGNDFVLIDNRRGRITRARQLARRVCDRRFGIGADGLILLENSSVAAYRMRYYNADGSDGGMCGNGGRCIARYAVLKRIVPARHRFDALGHVYDAEVRRTAVTLRMKDVSGMLLDAVLEADGGTFRYHWIDTGSPHAVFLVPQPSLNVPIADLPVEQLGRVLRRHEAFASLGTNVNFVERAGASRLRMRTYERGVEAETLACGTGSIACALGASITWNMRSPVTILTWSGKMLTVRFSRQAGRFTDVKLTGPAEITFEGSIDA